MKFDFNQIKNIAKDVSKEVVNVVGDKYLEIKANSNFDDGKYDEVIKAANEILKLDKFNYEIVLLKAKSLMKQEKYDEAIDAFIEALAIDNTKVEPLLHIATINELQENVDDAIDIYNSVLKKENNNASALLGLARNYFIKKDYEKVNKYFNQAEPQDDEDYYKWGISLKEMGQYENAKKLFEQANRMNPSREYRQEIKDMKNKKFEIEKEKAHDYFNNNEYGKAIKCFSGISNFPSSMFTHEDYYIWGLCLEEQGRELEAYNQFKKANSKKYCDKYKNKIRTIEQKNKKASNDFIKKATEYYKNKEYSKANTYFSKASKEKWNSLTNDNYYEWGVCLINLGDSVDAKNKFKKANNPYAYRKELLNTENKTILLEEAKICYNEKDYKNAIKLIDKVLELDPKNIKALMMKGDILTQHYHDDEGYEYYEKVLEVAPHNKKAKIALDVKQMMDDMGNPEKPSYWLNKGYTQSLKGNYLNAVDAIKKAIEIDPNNDVAWSRLCVAYQNLNEYPKALDAINRSLEIYSESDQSWFNKGQTLFWLGNFNESVECFNKAIKLNPNECDDAWAIKGMALIRLNHMYEAKYSLKKSLEANPNNKFALETIKHIPNFVDIDASTIDYIAAAKINVDPLWFGKLKSINPKVEELKAKGVNISLDFDTAMYALLKHDSKEYIFNQEEIDGAVIYVNKLWEEKCK